MNARKIIILTAAIAMLSTICRADQYWCPDLHTDDFVDWVDFAVLAGNWQQSGSALRGDFNASGTVDIYDIEHLCYCWLSDYECKNADFNLDYTINFADLARFANAWLSDINSTNWDAVYDLDDSESIGSVDLQILCRRWLKEYPEPNDVFESLKNALADGDVESAVSYFADSVTDEYETVFSELQAALPDMANGMGELQLIYSDDNIAQYEMLHDEGGGVISSFPVYFSKDGEGKWKIYCF